MALMAAPEWFGSQTARADTIQELLDKKNGMITVGPLKFTFTDLSVSGNRTAAQVEVTPVDSNGIEFRINPGLRLDSNMQSDQTEKIEISYTVMATAPILNASLSDDAFAQFTANGASAGVTETVDNQSLYVGTQPPNNVSSAALPDKPMMVTVDNKGEIQVPVRGQGANQDEAQLNTITNTFTVAPEPATIWSLLAGIALLFARKVVR
jgi:hypothetical protein